MQKSLARLFFSLSLVLFPLYLFAQTGTIKGKITDASTSEEVIGANVYLEGTNYASSTDLEGNFVISNIPVGTYNLMISYVSYKTKKMEGIVVSNTQILNIETTIEEDITQLGGVEIVGEREANSEIAVISLVREAEQVAVGVSAQQIAKSQDRDAAQVIRRIPGVSIVDNRFVLIRGLSQRYNTVMINGIITPSSEVDIKSFSFDLVPSSIIDRMFIYKSGAAELPGEFAGGVIQIYTKDAPIDNSFDISASLGFRQNTTFNTVKQIQGGSRDFLGFDDGTRRLPGGFPSYDYNGASPFNNLSASQRAALSNQMSNLWLATDRNINPDMRLGFSIGRRFNAGNVTIGTMSAINYSNTYQYADINLKGYEYGANGVVTAKAFEYEDKQIINNVRLGILSNWLFKINSNHSIEFKNLFNQMAFSETTLREGQDITSTSNDIRAYSYRYESRSIYSGQLVGKHEFNNDRSQLNWILGLSYTNRQEPDWRRLKQIRAIGSTNPFVASIPNDPNPTDAGRFYSNLTETVFSGAINYEHLLGSDEKDNDQRVKIRTGIYAERKDRTFAARFFGFDKIGNTTSIIGSSLDVLFSATQVRGDNDSFTLEEGTVGSDKYLANNTLLAGYLGVYLPITSRLKATIGFRGEYNLQEVNSRLRNFRISETSLPVFSPIPSLNLSYELNEQQLIRLGYTISVNRPEFRELAPFDFFDFLLNANVIGNTQLQTATIQNIDARWELYPSESEMISFGVFYKYFNNPIENFLLFTSNLGSINYTFVNSQSAQSYGAEIEVRKTFLTNFSFVANASYIFSQIDLGEFVNIPDPTGTVSRVQVSTVQDRNRPMMNQSPYLINAGIYYSNEESGWNCNLLYNVFGPRIFAVGNPLNPTIYEMPRHVIDLNVTKTLVDGKLDLKLGIQDLLNQPFVLSQDADRNAIINGNDQTIRSYRRGTSFTFGLNYRF
ncbi:MAG: TonB-dependent receptor [Cytophagales bacterium]|nr:MAG: TonB-dependent receptor [Cytophagales bacterium]